MYFWKSDEFGVVVRAKARLVARDFGQLEGIDFFDTFSPCPSVISIRLAALACELELDGAVGISCLFACLMSNSGGGVEYDMI